MSFDLKIKNGDLSVGKDGDVGIVVGNEKMRQDIVKILLTKLKENKYHPYYGSSLGALEIGSVPDKQLIEDDLVSLTEEAVGVLMRLQFNQSKIQNLTPGEVIVEVLSVGVSRDKSDPRGYNVIVSVLTRQLTMLTESITVRIM
jgi:phage baseplate assembly protein W